MWQRLRRREHWIAMVAVIGLVPAASCGGRDGPVESLRLEHAYLQRTCAPWDGPATTLFLSNGDAVGGVVPQPYLMISVYESVSRAAGERYRITPRSGDIGAALACAGESECEALSEAVVQFGPLDERAPARVMLRLTHADGHTEGGEVVASWLEPADLCG